MPGRTTRAAADWSERDLMRVSRRLHDQIGPALCAAGLHLSLIEQSVCPKPGSDAAEAIAGLRDALTASTQEVRTLSYLCDPTLVTRLGLAPALGYLARAVPLDFEGLGALAARKDDSAAAAFNLLRQALLAWSEACPAASFTLSATRTLLRLVASDPAPESVATRFAAAAVLLTNNRRSAKLKLSAPKGGTRR
jgi:signal transduction histidine kinase